MILWCLETGLLKNRFNASVSDKPLFAANEKNSAISNTDSDVTTGNKLVRDEKMSGELTSVPESYEREDKRRSIDRSFAGPLSEPYFKRKRLTKEASGFRPKPKSSQSKSESTLNSNKRFAKKVMKGPTALT